MAMTTSSSISVKPRFRYRARNGDIQCPPIEKKSRCEENHIATRDRNNCVFSSKHNQSPKLQIKYSEKSKIRYKSHIPLTSLAGQGQRQQNYPRSGRAQTSVLSVMAPAGRFDRIGQPV